MNYFSSIHGRPESAGNSDFLSSKTRSLFARECTNQPVSPHEISPPSVRHASPGCLQLGASCGRRGPSCLVAGKVAAEYPSLEALYKHLHANPELSLMEEKTAARVAAEFRTAGFEVTEKFGGNGVVAVLKNGDGPTLLIRTDLDGLPIEEETGLRLCEQGEDEGFLRSRSAGDARVRS